MTEPYIVIDQDICNRYDCECGLDPCQSYHYDVYVYLTGDTEGEPDNHSLPYSSAREALRSTLDDLFLDGYRRITVSDWIDTETTHNLRSSARRKKLLAERIARQQALKKEERSKATRYGRARAVVKRIIDAPTPADITYFFRRWKEVTGYGARDEELRDILSPAKEALIKTLIKMATENGWTHGHRIDPKVHNNYRNVVYIDTQLGQVSFHVRYDTYRDLPPYAKEWSGIRNTPEIVPGLFAGGFQAIAQANADEPQPHHYHQESAADDAFISVVTNNTMASLAQPTIGGAQ